MRLVFEELRTESRWQGADRECEIFIAFLSFAHFPYPFIKMSDKKKNQEHFFCVMAAASHIAVRKMLIDLLVKKLEGTYVECT